MHTRKLTLGLAAGALLLGHGAIAQQYQQPGQQMQQMREQMQGRMQDRMQDRMQQQNQRSGQMQQQGGQQDLAQGIRRFFNNAEQRMTEAVQEGNEYMLRQWTQQNLADNATVTVLMEVSTGGRTPNMLRAEHSDKQEILRKQAVMFSMVPELLRAVQDYNLDVQVTGVEQIDNNTAVVRTRVSESMTLGGFGKLGGESGQATQTSRWQGQQGSQQMTQDGQQQSQQTRGNQLGAALTGAGSGPGVNISGVADCKHLVYRNQSSSQLMIGMSNCRATASY